MTVIESQLSTVPCQLSTKIKIAVLHAQGRFRAVPPCFAEVTASSLLCIGSYRPDLSGRTKVARSVSHRRLSLSLLRSWCLGLLLFRIALQYLEYFNTDFGIVNWFLKIFPAPVGRSACGRHRPSCRSTGPKPPRHCEGRSPVAISCGILQSCTPYQEIPTACGLGMTVFTAV